MACAKNALDKRTGGTVNGYINLLGRHILLKGDDRKHFGIQDQDGRYRMWLYKDKEGDGVRLHNGYDGGGEYVFHKDGGFRAPASVHAGAASMIADGNISGSIWGGLLSEWLNNQMSQRGAKNTALLATNGWWKCGDTGFTLQWAKYGKGYGDGTYDFPLPMKFSKGGFFCIGYVGTAINFRADFQSHSANLVDNETVRVTVDNGLETQVIAIGI